ncbi:MAG: alpha/beta hydrolase, partial [Treponema sp.]|nr:alpha/beta hydrolase [Treponema sp.]
NLLLKIILLVPCVIPGVKKGRVEPLVTVEKDEGLLSSLTKSEYDSFTMMNVMLTREVWERYKKFLMPALASADWDFLNHKLNGKFSFDPDKMNSPCELPCLIITGKQDSVVGYKDQFDLMKIYTNSTYCAVNNAGHNIQIEQPKIFEDLVTAWLK